MLAHKTEKIFRAFRDLLGGGWGTFLGFREVFSLDSVYLVRHDGQVVLATEALPLLHTRAGLYRWMFRLHDRQARGSVQYLQLPPIVSSVLVFLTG